MVVGFRSASSLELPTNIYDSPFSSCPGSCVLCTARRKMRKISICSKLNRFICRMRGDWRSSSIIRSLIRLKFKMRTIDIWLYERGDRIMETDAKVELLIVLWHFRSRLMVQLTHIWDYRGNAAQLMLFIAGPGEKLYYGRRTSGEFIGCWIF